MLGSHSVDNDKPEVIKRNIDNGTIPKNKLKKIGLIIYLITNVGLCLLYGYEILKYFQGIYNYDGMRYLIPIAVADLLFIISCVILFFYFRFSKVLGCLLGLGILHNIAHGCGVERIPFIGFILAVVSIFYLCKLMFTSSKKF